MVTDKVEKALDVFEHMNDRESLSDSDYWKLFTPSKDEGSEDVYGGEDSAYGLHSHEISIDVNIIFKNMNGIVLQQKQKDINCNIKDLELFMKGLKKTVRMLDETKSDSIGDGSGGF